MSITQQQPIIDSIYGLLSNNSTLTSYVASRIYDTQTPQDPTLPMVVFSVLADPIVGYFNGIDSIELDFQVDIYNKLESGPKATRVIADAVYASLHRQNLTASGYLGCSILCRDRGTGVETDLIVGTRVQQDADRILQTYRMWGTGT